MNNEKKLHKIWWLWVPLALIAGQTVLELTMSSAALSHLHSESGPHEAAEFLLPAAIMVTITLLDRLSDFSENLVIFERGSEVQELYFFCFVLLYVVVLRRRIVQNQR